MVSSGDSASHFTAGSGKDVLIHTLKDMPEAASLLAADAWNSPGKFALNTAKTLGESAVVGAAMGYIIPSSSLAAKLATVVFTAPIVYGTAKSITEAYNDGNKPGANIDALSKNLAYNLTNEGWNFALGTAGSYAGAVMGHRIASSDTMAGEFAQKAQRSILRTENRAMIALNDAPASITGLSKELTVGPKVENLAQTAESVEKPNGPTLPRSANAWFLPKDTAISNRFSQANATPQEYTLRMGSLHGHSYYSDGMGTPADIFAKAKADGMDFYAITDHNHLAARGGVGPSDPRAGDQAKVPILASMPKEYDATMADAAAATEKGKFVAIVGVEMGTIGHVGKPKSGGGGGGDSGGDGGSAFVGEGKINKGADLLGSPLKEIEAGAHGHEEHGHSHKLPEEFAHMEVPANLPPPVTTMRVFEPDGTVIEHPHVLPQEAAAQAYREQAYLNALKAEAPESLSAGTASVLSPRAQALADAAARDGGHYSGINHVNVFEFPQLIIADRAGDGAGSAAGAVHYPDGDFNTLLKKIGNSPDTTGKTAVWQLNHPRYLADNNPNLPDNLRGRDYGAKSFPSDQAWLAAMDPRVSLVEVITGEALNPDPIEVMKPHDMAPINMAGYIDKGLHVAPTYGRDDHFALPGGRPAGTGIMAATLDKAGLLDGMRNRQTIATTSTALLKGYMTANDKFPMGTIFDQNAVNALDIKMNLVGDIDPRAKYAVKLWADPTIGDGNLATMIQTKSLTGQDLINAKGQVAFDKVQHQLGNKSAWYVEVQRTDPKTQNNDFMWTAPVWVEPLSGASHSLLTRALVGGGSSYLLGTK